MDLVNQSERPYKEAALQLNSPKIDCVEVHDIISVNFYSYTNVYRPVDVFCMFLPENNFEREFYTIFPSAVRAI